MADLANCPVCDKLYIKVFRPYCDVCHREIEGNFSEVYGFLPKRENRSATMEEVHEGTGVDKELIIRFVREGRLHLAQFPNLGYPCEKCNTSIREGRLCKDCSEDLKSGLNQLQREKSFENRKNTREKAKIQTYHSLNSRLGKK